MVTYEQPLNERVRTFMRVEQLYGRCSHYLKQDASWDSHFALMTLLELLSLATRGDLKRELMKELKRQLTSLEQLQSIPHIDQQKLSHLVKGHSDLIVQLDTFHGQLWGHLKDNDFVNSIKQRAVIPGGTCDFDLPAYHHWLSQPNDKRQQILLDWLQPFNAIHAAVTACLDLIRGSTEDTECLGARGFYQRTLDPSQPNQMIRVILDRNSNCFPEISAGKHRFSIRFLAQKDPNEYPKQVTHDVEFIIATCAF